MGEVCELQLRREAPLCAPPRRRDLPSGEELRVVDPLLLTSVLTRLDEFRDGVAAG